MWFAVWPIPPIKNPGYQRWSPRERSWPWGHILKSLALASKVKSLALASKPQVLENCSVLGSRTAQFFEWLEFCRSPKKFFVDFFLWRAPEKIFEDLFFEIAWKKILKTFFFFGEHFRLCPWSLALASSIPLLGLESVCPWKGCLGPRIFLWPWPRVLCPRLHLCWLCLCTSSMFFC